MPVLAASKVAKTELIPSSHNVRKNIKDQNEDRLIVARAFERFCFFFIARLSPVNGQCNYTSKVLDATESTVIRGKRVSLETFSQ